MASNKVTFPDPQGEFWFSQQIQWAPSGIWRSSSALWSICFCINWWKLIDFKNRYLALSFRNPLASVNFGIVGVRRPTRMAPRVNPRNGCRRRA